MAANDDDAVVAEAALGLRGTDNTHARLKMGLLILNIEGSRLSLHQKVKAGSGALFSLSGRAASGRNPNIQMKRSAF